MITVPVEPGGISIVCPGFNGVTNGTPARVLQTAGVTVNASRPRAPFPNSECTDAVFELSLMFTSAMVSY